MADIARNPNGPNSDPHRMDSPPESNAADARQIDPDEPPDGTSKQKGSLLRETALILACVLILTWVLQTFVGRQYVIPSESMEQTLHGCMGCTNDRIVVDKTAYWLSDPQPGDVVVFKAPSESWNAGWQSPRSPNTIVRTAQNALAWFGFAPPNENTLVKRVIAVGGQQVQCRNADGTGVKVNGKSLHEPYVDVSLQEQNAWIRPHDLVAAGGQLKPCYGPDFGPVTVPQGLLWVMGDNRGMSADSRYHTSDRYHGMVPVGDVRGKVRFIIYPLSRIGMVDSVNPQK